MYLGSWGNGFSLQSLAYLYNHVKLPKIKPVRGTALSCNSCGNGYGPLRKLDCGNYACNSCFKNGGKKYA